MLIVRTCGSIMGVARCLIHILSYLCLYVLIRKRKLDISKCGYLDGLYLFGSTITNKQKNA